MKVDNSILSVAAVAAIDSTGVALSVLMEVL